MGEERADASAPSRKARYRFEYGRRRTANVPVALGVLAALGLAGAAWVNGLKPMKMTQKPPVATRPLALTAYTLAKVEEEAAAPVAAPKPKAPPEAAPVPPPAPAPAAVTAAEVAAAPAPPSPAPVNSPSPGEVRLAALAKAAVEPPTAPSPDPCGGIRGTVERMVCADPAVRAASQRVEAAYRHAMQLTDNRGKVLREHERWLARRPAVDASRGAALAYFEDRYRELWPVPMRVGPRLPPIFKPEAEHRQ